MSAWVEIGGFLIAVLTLGLGFVTFRTSQTVNFLKLKLKDLEELEKVCKVRVEILESERDGLRDKIVELMSKLLLGRP